LEFRFLQLRAWELSGANLAVQINDLAGAEVHRSQHDEPGRNHWATCGLQWAVDKQTNTFDDNASTIIATVSSSADDVNVLVHLHMLWRFQGQPAPVLNPVQPKSVTYTPSSTKSAMESVFTDFFTQYIDGETVKS
jgi:hypothetical protein